MPSLHEIYPEMRAALARSQKASAIAPDGGDFAAILAALLSRSFSEAKARAIVAALKAAGLESPDDLARADLSELTEATRGLRDLRETISPKGMKPLQLLSRWIVSRGGLEAIETAATEDLRDDLRTIPGIGPAGADALLLLGMNRPVYPVDRATYRIFARHGWIDPSTDYDEARGTVEALEPGNALALAALAHDLEEIGKQYCRATKAKCENCPLAPFLPAHGPYES